LRGDSNGEGGKEKKKWGGKGEEGRRKEPQECH